MVIEHGGECRVPVLVGVSGFKLGLSQYYFFS